MDTPWFVKFMRSQVRLIRRMFKRQHRYNDINVYANIWIGNNSESFRKYFEKYEKDNTSTRKGGII